MTQKKQNLINVIMVIISWITLAFIGKFNLRKYSLSSGITILITVIDCIISKKKIWWSFKNKPYSFISNEFPFIVGPFLASSIWSLKIANGKFKTFIFINIFIQLIFVTFFMNLMKNLKWAKLVWMNKIQFFLWFFYKMFILYGIQYYIDTKISKSHIY